MGLLIQRRKQRNRPHSEGYWPGYVDALTNVVLNLLFLVAILAAGVFALGMEASRKQLLPTMDEIRARWFGMTGDEQTPAQSQTTTVPEILIDVGIPQSTQAAGLVKFETVRTSGHETLAQIIFDGDAVALVEADVTAMRPSLEALAKGHANATVALWAVSDRDPIHQRASYMRVMAVRDQLSRAGLKTEHMVTRILSGSSTDVKKQRVFLLFKRNKEQDDSE